MPILNKLEYLDETKQQIKNALNTKFNSQITDEDTFRSYVDKITNIYTNWPKVPGEGTSLKLTNTKKGRLGLDLSGDLSQETTSGKNLLPYNQLTTTTVNGITFTPVFEGSNLLYVKATGLASADATYKFYGFDTTTPQKVFDSATKISFGLTGSSSSYGMAVWGLNSGGVNIGSEIYDETEYATGFQLTGIGLRVHSGANVDIEFKPMLRLSNITDDTYEPYTNGASPNPDYPQEIKVVTGNQNVYVNNKNLLPTLNISKTLNGVTFTINEDGTITANGTATSQIIFPINSNTPATTRNILLKDGVYKFYFDGVTTSSLTYFIQASYIGDDGSVKYPTDQNGNVGVALTKSTLIGFSIIIRVDTALNNVIFKPMLINSNTKIPYVKALPQTYPLSLDSLELAKIGDYKDYIYRENGKWYKYGVIGKVVYNGTEAWTLNTTYTHNVFYSTLLNYARVVNQITILANYYKGVPNLWGISDFGNNYNNSISLRVTSGDSINNIYISNDNISTVEEFKAWLSTHNTTVYYVLKTPTIIEITDTTLIEQLDNLYNANSYDDTTIIFSDGDLPIVMKASALMKGGA